MSTPPEASGTPHGLRSVEAVLEALAHLVPDEDEAAVFFESLTDYVTLGDRAAGEMPEFHRQLEADPSLLELVAELRSEYTSWEGRFTAAVAGLKPKPEPAWLALVNGAWQWVDQTRARLRPAAIGDRFVQGLRRCVLADLVLTPGMPANIPQRPRFALALENDAGLELDVDAEKPTSWRFTFRLRSDSPIDWADVALGDSRGQITGWRHLTTGEETVFAVDPPVDQAYQLHAEWSAHGKKNEASYPLPLLKGSAS
jgi:hypothetical protein